MTRKFAFIVTLVLCTFVADIVAQKAVISFSNAKYDFGQIAEEEGNVSNVFEFTNTGNAPLVIQRVTASCGCTTPDWTRTPVEPGKKGRVTATYNPMGRPGSFSKVVTVYSNASNEMEQLIISGNVTPKATASATSGSSNSFPLNIGNLGLTGKSIHFGNVDKGTATSRTISIRNNSSSQMSISLADVPSYVIAKVQPEKLQPNQEGVIEITMDSKKTSEWGPLNADVSIVLNGSKQTNDNKISLSGNVIEDFSRMSASEKRQAPILEIKSTNLVLGKIKKGNKVRGKFAVKNVGSNPLEIRRVINNNSDVNVYPLKASIRSGKTENLHLDIDSKYLQKGNYKKTFSIQTNDPNRSLVVYTADFTVI
ncbi:MAG: DUF1573 domain-containing protein [Paludibacteraceae bacterium]